MTETNIVLNQTMLQQALIGLYQILSERSSPEGMYVRAYTSLVHYYEVKSGDVFSVEDLVKIKEPDVTEEYVNSLITLLTFSINWDALQDEDKELYVNLQGTVEALCSVLAALKAGTAAKSEEATKKKKPKTKSQIKKDHNELQDFLNGEWITSLLIQREGERKGYNHGVPETFGEYFPLKNEAHCLLMDGESYAYMPRSTAINYWFAGQIRSYASFINGKDKDKAHDLLNAQGLSDLLSGFHRGTCESTEQDWASGFYVQITFKGNNLPGVALKVFPVVFTEEEITELATQIREIKKVLKDAKKDSKSPEVLSYADDVQVTIKTPVASFQPPIDHSRYDLSLINTDRKADDLVSQIKGVIQKEEKPQMISLLLHGIPGTGKSKLANYIGEQLGQSVIKRTYAELQSMYVGEGEKQLHDAFMEAQIENSILLIDEIDSIAGNRSDADRNYQRTFVNQLLTELDDFKGIFIATSNSIGGLDPAVLRRLFLKLEFKFLTAKQTQKCFELYFPSLSRHKLGEIEYLTPGDFYAVSEAIRYEIKKPSLKRVRELLSQEVSLKKKTLTEVIRAEKKPGYII